MRVCLAILLCSYLCVSISAQEKAPPLIGNLDPEMAERKQPSDGLAWHDVTQMGMEGRILPDQSRQRWFDRFPESAEQTVTQAVWNLSRHSAGMMVRFKTDATSIHVHYRLLSKNLQMSHMPATGVSGVDLYARDDSGNLRWVQVTRPTSQEVKTALVSGLADGYHEFAMYLPLYNGIESMSIGVADSSKFELLSPRNKPLVFYGTSITHGACASRPGMVHTAILGRRFDMPVVNLGFSGNGKMDLAVGDFLTQIDAAAYVIDCLPNMNAKMVTQKCIPLIKRIRAKRPDTPIILVEDRRNTNSWILPARDKHHTENHEALQSAYRQLMSESISRLHYIQGDALYGTDGDGATDGSHANDLGFMRQADAFDPVIRRALGFSPLGTGKGAVINEQ